MMNFARCRHLVSLFVYCGVAVLVIVNGQSTTDDNIDKDEVNRLIDIVEVLRAELATTKEQLATAVDRFAKLEGQDEKSQESKLRCITYHYKVEYN